MNNFCGDLDLIFGNCKRTKAATKNLMRISAEEKPDFTAFNELVPDELDYSVPKVSIVTAKQPNTSAIACFDSESFQFVTKCCFELSTVSCVKARWNNITLCIICGYFSSNNVNYSVKDLTTDLKKIASFLNTLGPDILKLFVGDFNAYHSSWSREECLNHYKKKKGESVKIFCNVTEMYVLNPFQPSYIVGAKETVCDLILGCRAFKEGIVDCKMELNNSSDHKLIRMTISHNKLLKYLRDKTPRLDMSRYKDMKGFWFFSVPEKTDTASEGSNPDRHNAGHRHDGQRDVPGVPGVASCLRMPDSANWEKL